MPSRRLSSLFVGLTTALAGALLPAQAATLFDASGASPAAQGWLEMARGGSGSVTQSGGLLTLDTTASNAIQHGFFLMFSPVALDAAAGFTLDFTLRIDAASTLRDERAGFSLLFVGQAPSQSLELGFGTDSVFAYRYDAAQADPFTRGAGASFAAGLLHDYRLTVQGGTAALAIDGRPALTTALQDYSAQGLPYSRANQVFFGDDTTSASAAVALGRIGITSPVPEPASSALWLLALAAAPLWRRVRGD